MRRLIPTGEIRRFLRSRDGATAIEYALIASGIAAALVAVIGTLGGTVSNLWLTVKNAFG